MSELDREEKQILDAYESGKLERSKNAAKIRQHHEEYARAMFRKDARVNIRLSAKDLEGCKNEHWRKGFPIKH